MPNPRSIPPPAKEHGPPRAGTKQEALIRMLGQNKGASIKEIVSETGWRSNTVHSALATLRKSGWQIAVVETAGQRYYQIKS
jgi:DNA-binding IclR family transcriptional regulator